MIVEPISEVGIDNLGRFYVTPSRTRFPYIYREAMEINWDETGAYLHAPSPPRAELASPVWWFQRILAAANEQGSVLLLEPQTKWLNVPRALQDEIAASLPVGNQ